uniref:Uncharacterized protein n=1 Tax=Ditylenchus dipsaci TaxID=166011 RepID=A0A915DRP2_9BILA
MLLLNQLKKKSLKKWTFQWRRPECVLSHMRHFLALRKKYARKGKENPSQQVSAVLGLRLSLLLLHKNISEQDGTGEALPLFFYRLFFYRSNLLPDNSSTGLFFSRLILYS